MIVCVMKTSTDLTIGEFFFSFFFQHFGSWRDVMDDTSYKALCISRRDSKAAMWLVHQHFEVCVCVWVCVCVRERESSA